MVQSYIEKLRKHKIFKLAIFDIVVSFISIAVIFLIAWKYYFPRLHWWAFVLAAAYVVFSIGITAHIIFGVNTELNYTLGLSYKPSS